MSVGMGGLTIPPSSPMRAPFIGESPVDLRAEFGLRAYALVASMLSITT